MSAPYICADCGGPIDPGRGLIDDAGVFYHAEVNECIAALKADRDRYRGVLVALRDAERAYARARSAEDAAYRATCGASGDALHHAMLDLSEASGACDAAGDAASAAAKAAIAAVEEG